MKINDHRKQHIRRCFNSASLNYDQYCQLQIECGELLTAVLFKQNKLQSYALDLGCGTGIVTHALKNLGVFTHLTGIDISENLVKIAQQRLAYSNVNVISADFDNIPFCNQSFDLVFSNMALQWSTSLVDTVAEIKRVLKPGGCLAFSLPVSGTFKQTRQILFELTGNSYFIDFPDLEFLTHLLTSLGFSITLNYSQQWNLEFPDIITALHSFKKIGAFAHDKTNHNKTWINKILYQKLSTQPCQLNYQMIFIVAVKKET